ncbi:MAG TPA: FlgD immunoglobulin-like domain containing protein, partial [bacterium]|nr:FlgD immunoglobulin-like domain containing protein [bacterium]
GLYPVAISATDASGNPAIAQTGNDWPFLSVITVDRRTSATATETDAPTASAYSANGTLTIASTGTILTQSLSSISVTLNDATGVSTDNTTITLLDPDGTTYNGSSGATLSTSGSGTTVVFTLTLTSALSTEGSYTITAVTEDTLRNTDTYTRTFSLDLPAVSVSSQFESSVKAYPQPAVSGSVTIGYTLDSAASLVTLKVFSLRGSEVFSSALLPAASGANTFSWTLTDTGGAKVSPGVYFYKMEADYGTSKYGALKKLVVIK